jgi:raffinose/stachyose/melibiose transport system permease protein
MTDVVVRPRRGFRAGTRVLAPRAPFRGARGQRLRGWLFLLPALAAYSMFVLWPLVTSFRYSFYSWDGIDPAKWVGLANYKAVFTDPQLLGSIEHSGILIIFFSFIPTALGLMLAAFMRSAVAGRLGTVARVIIFLPQVVALVAAGIAWSWLLGYNGALNQIFYTPINLILKLIGLGAARRAWLGDFNYALPAVGVIGVWVMLGFCTVLLTVGMGKIDPSLYEASQLDGAGPVREFFSITLPSLRQEIGVCLTVTMIAALSAFDIVYISTQGGPANQTMVPGLLIYLLAFTNREVGLASALAVVLMVLVILCILPIQWFVNRGVES